MLEWIDKSTKIIKNEKICPAIKAGQAGVARLRYRFGEASGIGIFA